MSGTSERIKYTRHDIYDQLVDEWDVFDTYVDLFVFAAAVGYATSDKATVQAYSGDEYRGEGEMLWIHLNDKPNYRAVAASLAYQFTGELESLTDAGVQLEVLARYAHAGALHLDAEFGDAVTTPRDGLISFVDEFQDGEAGDDEAEILDEIVDSFDSDTLQS
jgi:hypothetical protein